MVSDIVSGVIVKVRAVPLQQAMPNGRGLGCLPLELQLARVHVVIPQ